MYLPSLSGLVGHTKNWTYGNISIELKQPFPFHRLQLPAALVPVPEGNGGYLENVHQVFLAFHQLANCTVPKDVEVISVWKKIYDSEYLGSRELRFFLDYL